MHDLLVVMGASAVRGTMKLYCSQLRDAKIDARIEAIPPTAGIGLKEKVAGMRRIGEKYADWDRVVLSDAFDVTFYGSKRDVYDKIPAKGLLWAAEKNCFPDQLPAAIIGGKSPWRFANGGLVCGTPRAFMDWADEAESHPAYQGDMLDQQFLNARLAEGSHLCAVDSETELFFCLYGGHDELDFYAGIPMNRLTGTSPAFIHANGNWPPGEMFAGYVESIRTEVKNGRSHIQEAQRAAGEHICPAWPALPNQ